MFMFQTMSLLSKPLLLVSKFDTPHVFLQKTIIYVYPLKRDEQSWFVGLSLTHTIPYTLDRLFKALHLTTEHGTLRKRLLLAGGPENTLRNFLAMYYTKEAPPSFLHHPDEHWYVTHDYTWLLNIANGNGPKYFELFAGYYLWQENAFKDFLLQACWSWQHDNLSSKMLMLMSLLPSERWHTCQVL
jgi:putative AlgH/UPF0301 family transcriptional regulator